MHTSIHSESPESSDIPARNGLRLIARSPVIGFFATVICGYGWSAPGWADFASARLDTSVGVSGPHDFAVRISAVRQHAVDNSQAS